MVDVCCLCGDVGFSDKLFRCSDCGHRFQHWYCSNYYGEYGESNQVCDWCQCDKRRSVGKKGGRPAGKSAGKGAIRRYKLLKDVMC
ncbi:hypothetical protein SASPL_102741 [Salvia splendens]|uniref:PHD-type zinc finger plants domain-containing protein n=1 Tax=Salvia splendens TaxID=180675 RepID=A0A8X8YSH3_SALSN|nr:hypothetical protein SASPL_102741 [Salvia splendens]